MFSTDRPFAPGGRPLNLQIVGGQTEEEPYRKAGGGTTVDSRKQANSSPRSFLRGRKGLLDESSETVPQCAHCLFLQTQCTLFQKVGRKSAEERGGRLPKEGRKCINANKPRKKENNN